jgi:hypothetical protein
MFSFAGINRGIILTWILEKYDMKVSIQFNWLRIGLDGEFSETVMNIRAP